MTEKAKVVAMLTGTIARMEAALETNKPEFKVYCWPKYWLGVAVKGSECGAVSIECATIVRKPSNATFRNGANVPAELMPRDVALRAAIDNARQTLAAFA